MKLFLEMDIEKDPDIICELMEDHEDEFKKYYKWLEQNYKTEYDLSYEKEINRIIEEYGDVATDYIYDLVVGGKPAENNLVQVFKLKLETYNLFKLKYINCNEVIRDMFRDGYGY